MHYNTKISTSKKNENEARKKRRDRNHPHGRAISQNEMVHLLLKYPEIITNLSFIHISTLPLEFSAGTEKNKNLDTIQQSRNNRDGNQVNVFNVIEDSARTDNFVAARVRNKINDLATWRMHTNSEKLTFEIV